MTQRETPDWLADALIEASGLTDNMTVLEPSCGNGKIIKRMRDNFSFTGLKVTGIELNKELIEQAHKELTDYSHFIRAEFMEVDFLPKFDRIIAAPPFKNNVDVQHIQKMYGMLNAGGRLVSLTAPLWVVNNESHQIAFRSFLQGKTYTLKFLPDNTFMEKGKTVHTARIVIFK